MFNALFKKGLLKGGAHLAYKSAYGMSAKELLAHKLRTLIVEYEKHGCVTDRFLDQLRGEQRSVVDDGFEMVAQIAGYAPLAVSITGMFAALAKDTWDDHRGVLSPMYYFINFNSDHILNERYYREEEGKLLDQNELAFYVDLARIALKEVEKGEKDFVALQELRTRWEGLAREVQSPAIPKIVEQRYLRIEKAIEKGDISAVRAEISEGIDDSVQSSLGRFPLLCCAVKAQTKALELTQLLVEAGCSVDSRQKNGDTPLLRACGGGTLDPHIVTFLLEHGARVNARGKGGWTATHYLALCADYTGADTMLSILIDHGFDINIVDRNGNTAMHELAGRNEYFNEEDIAKIRRFVALFVSSGFNKQARNHWGKTAREAASYKRIIRILDECGFR